MQMMSLKPSKHSFIHVWNIGGALNNPKGMRIDSYNPNGVVKVVNGLDCLDSLDDKFFSYLMW